MSNLDTMPGIDARRLWSTLEASSEIGATPGGGLRRLALSEEDRAMRDLFAFWARESGYEVGIDRLGNMFVQRPGTDPKAPPVLMGSHLDTQAKGGRYDGILGVLAGLEVLRSLDDHGIATVRGIEVVNWSNEEGARFQPPMLCSLVFAGGASVEWALDREDKSGVRFGSALEAIGYAGEEPVGGRELDSYFELHIEQGPVLDETGDDVGIVTSAYVMAGMRIQILGQTSHVGPTPMHHRKNALVGAAYVAVEVNEMGWRYAPEDGKSSVARIDVSPNLPGLLSDEAQLYIDFRHPDPDRLDAMTADVEAAVTESARRSRTEISIAERWGFGGLRFDPGLASLLTRQATALSIRFREMASQAGHDAYHMNNICPTVMIFSPCKDGITHNEAEDVDWDRTTPAVELLFRAVLERAGRADG
ncbi:MAG: Zn-dependent hydrolase [Gemmatimonadetes bacterium]|nr:Zn-dependent hydrolase [Gemmatimonadota bacterium]